jgi:hypothetical protein
LAIHVLGHQGGVKKGTVITDAIWNWINQIEEETYFLVLFFKIYYFKKTHFNLFTYFRQKFQNLIKFVLKKGYRTLRRVKLNKISFICKKNIFICKKYKKGKRGTK